INNARGTNSSTGVVEGEAGSKPKTKNVASTALRPSNPASQHWIRPAFLVQRPPFDTHSTIAGTIVSSASALVQKRSAPSDTYPRPQPVRITPAASRNEVASGAIKTPNRMKIETPRTLSKTVLGLISRVMQNAPIRASVVLVKNQEAAVQIGTPAWCWATKCGGTIATRNIHQTLRGDSRSAARRIALGGQKAEFG